MAELGKYIDFKNGKKRPTAKGGYPVYGGNGVIDYVNEFNFNNGIVIGRVGVYCGSVFLPKDRYWVSDNAISATPKENADLFFAYYLLKSLKLNDRRIGTSQPLLTQEILNRIEVEIPSIDVQRKIGNILYKIDEKIKANEQINNNLQQQAQAIYYDLFSTNCCDDWEQGVLSNIAEITMGQSPSGDSYNENRTGTVFFQGRAEFGTRFPTIRLYTTEPKRLARENDILMSVRAPVGDLNIAHEDCCIGRGLAAIRSKTGQQSFLLYSLLSLRPQLNVFNGEGTVFGSINRDSLNKLPLTIPDKEAITRFESIVAPMDAIIRANHDENCRLAGIRDSLLPRLMSGEIDVSDVEF